MRRPAARTPPISDLPASDLTVSDSERSSRQADPTRQAERLVRTLLRVTLRNWPPPGLDDRDAIRLARKLGRDFEQRLIVLVANGRRDLAHRSGTGNGKSNGATLRPGAEHRATPVREPLGRESASPHTGTSRLPQEPAAAAPSGDDTPPVDCHLVGWEYEIVEIGGIPVRCRVEFFECSDGTSYRREVQL